MIKDNKKKLTQKELESRTTIRITTVIVGGIVGVIALIGIFFGKEGMEIFGGVVMTALFIMFMSALTNTR